MAFLSGWDYRKPVTISRASGAVTNYQLKILVGESSGASGENVDCGGHCKTDFSDLRFTPSDGTTLLDYWIESVSGTTPNQLATVWVEFDSIGTGATTFYMYYGNAEASSLSSGKNTFILFDDFEWGSNGDNLNTGANITWTTAYGTSISTAQKWSGTRSGRVPQHASRALMSCDLAQSDNVAWRTRVYRATANTYVPVNIYGGSAKRIYWDTQTGGAIRYYDGSYKSAGGTLAAATWTLLEFRNINFAAGTYDIWKDDSVIKSGATMHSDGGQNGKLYILGDDVGSGDDVFWDNFLVRHFRATEPAWGSWGSEEAPGGGGAFGAHNYYRFLLAAVGGR
jgi:hypothetical protein